jgi:uncharacterized membrane protein YfcA
MTVVLPVVAFLVALLSTSALVASRSAPARVAITTAITTIPFAFVLSVNNYAPIQWVVVFACLFIGDFVGGFLGARMRNRRKK